MKNAKTIGAIGQILMVIGSALYILELLPNQAFNLVGVISAIYIVSLVLMFIGWCGTKEERKARKAEQKAEKLRAAAAKKAA